MPCYLLCAGVGEFVERVHRLGTGAAPCGTAAPADPPACFEAAPQPAQAAEQQQPAADTPLPAPLCESPTESLLHCRERLQQRPVTAPGVRGSPARGGLLASRPASASPRKVKPLMQVKGEQEAALRQLAHAPQPFRASPLPLSTMEPRFQRQQAQEEARRQASLSQRRQQLAEQQRPFGFEQRAAERQHVRALLHGTGPGSLLAAAAAARPATPPFHALPVPVSTTEASAAFFLGVGFAEALLRRV